MYATIRNYPGNTGLADALVENESEVKRIISEIGGFEGYFLVRTDSGTASFSLYQDKRGADESNEAAATWLKDNLPELAGASPQVSEGEVVILFSA
jgi:hypothetical protein